MDQADRHLVELTGDDSIYWIGRVQALILAAGDWENEIHPQCDVGMWVGALAHELDAAILATKPDRDEYAENMAAATALAIVLARWAIRIQRAKAFDPNRPIEARRKGHAAALLKSRAIADAAWLDDEPDPLDALYFPGQRWDDPHGPHATDGTFT